MKDGKVLHVSEAMHKRVREHCMRSGVSMRHWTEQVLTSALENRETPVVKLTPPANKVAVEKKPYQEVEQEHEDDIEPWSLPPFWVRG